MTARALSRSGTQWPAPPDWSRRLRRRLIKWNSASSVDDLKAAIDRFIAETNSDPKPFVGTADPKQVLAAVKRGKQALESLH